jgi:hypothetical protein
MPTPPWARMRNWFTPVETRESAPVVTERSFQTKLPS